MTPGSVITVAVVGGFTVGVIYAIGCDIVRWVNQRAVHHGRQRLLAVIERDEARQLQGDLLEAVWALPALEPDHERRRRGIA